MKKKGWILNILIGLLSISLISAFNGSVADYLNNEWVRFALVFVLFATAIYFTVLKTTNEKTISMVIAIALGLLISISIAQKSWLYNYVGEGVSDWLIVISLLIGVFFLFKTLIYYNGFLWGTIIGLAIFTGFTIIIDLESVIPIQFQTDSLLSLIWAINDLGEVTGAILLVIGIIAFIWKYKKHIGKGIVSGGKGIGKAYKHAYETGQKIPLPKKKQKEMEKEQKKMQVKQITADIHGLKKAYNDIQRKNPADPRLRDIVSQIKKLKKQK